MTFDFLRYVDDYGVDYVTESGNLSRNWLLAMNCPFCSSDSKYKLGVPAGGNRSYCWACGGHSLFDTLKILTPDISYGTLMKEYGDEYSYVQRITIEHAQTLAFPFPPLTAPAERYLLRRGFDLAILADKYNLKWGGVVGDFAYRIIIPIYHKGVLVSYQGRSISKAEGVARYKTLDVWKSLVDPKSVLFNLDNCRDDWVVVVEGAFNVFRFGDGSCASLGTSFTDEQVHLLADYKRVIIMFDCEESAQKKACSLAERVSAFGVQNVEVIDMEFEGDKDLAECTEDEILEIKRELKIL